MNRCNLFTCVLAIILISGCSEKKDDFAGISFKNSRKDLEAESFICVDSDENKEKTVLCKNFSRAADAFGYPTKGIEVTLISGAVSHISVNLPDELTTIQAVIDLTTKIGGIYKPIPDRDINTIDIHMYNWKRPDGSSITLLLSQGIPGITSDTISLVAHSPEWEKETSKNYRK